MTALAKYDAMVSAIAECEAVDEVKDIVDKAVALEVYYRQARNIEAERQAANVRLRAERRAGELLKLLARAETPNPSGANQHEVASTAVTQPKSPYATALSDTGMSRQTAAQYQGLANVPEDEFEAALADPKKPSRRAILNRSKPEPKVDDRALWLWGRLRDFERDGLLTDGPSGILETMTDAMRADVLRLAPQVSDFLSRLEVAQNEAA